MITRLLALICLALTAAPAAAKEYRLDRKVLPHKLQDELAAVGYASTRVMCHGDACVLDILGEKSATLPARARKAVDAHDPTDMVKARIKLLTKKLSSGTITTGERDELLLILVDRLIPEARS